MKITSIETARAPHYGLLYCRVHTDEGITGSGETYYIPSAVEGVIHDWMAPRLLGADPFDIEGHWRFLYERAANFGARGAELRAISTIDLALWDIKGKATNLPVWQLLGGRTQEGVRAYHSIGYGKQPAARKGGKWPGHGLMGEKDPHNDYWKAIHEPEAFAKEILSEGTEAVKLWSLDFAAHKQNGNLFVRQADIDEGLKPFFKMREAVGNRLELILDGHGFFQLPMAIRIAEAMREVQPLCLEDVIRPDCIDTIRDFRDRGGVPIAVSEMMIGTEDYRLVLEKRAADYVMIDPTWVGGISQTLKLTDLAQAYNLPVMMHDCTGPLTLLAGIQVGIARGNVAWQETVRRNLRVTYPAMITDPIEVQGGRCLVPEKPGIGTQWRDEMFQAPNEVRISRLS
ncbi:MAG TPA: mandelate racemase/muconate lactonizing enzyme family protein [Chthoniobacteraceae bacterium]|nr:mandelate racemase/muconate lactonizing enzyme family protein [Chthoniobacteraceae bacterium]